MSNNDHETRNAILLIGGIVTGFLALVVRQVLADRREEQETNEFRWTDKNRWE